jgi:hypothetical protein
MGMSAGRSLLSGFLGAAAEYPIGAVTEEIEKKHPRLALPFNIATGIISGMTAERVVERGLIKALGPKTAKPKVSELLRKQFRKRFIPGIDPKIIVPQQRVGMKLYSGIAPLTEVGDLYTAAIGTPLWDNLVMMKLPKTLEKIPGGQSINRGLIVDYRGNLPNTPGYLKTYDDMQRYQRLGKEYAMDLGRRLQDAPPDTQLRMGEYIRGELDVLPKKEMELADEAKRALYDLGKQAVDLELMKEATFFKHVGRYMPRLYSSKEYGGLLTRFGLKKPTRLDLSRFKQRKDIPKEIRKAMGEILTPGYPVAKGLTQLTHDVEMAKFFKGISNNPEWSFIPEKSKGVIPEGFKQLPETKKLGPLSKAWVHPEIHADLQEVTRLRSTTERTWRRLLGMWKVGKIANPKTMARNLFGGNVLLSHLGGFPMWRQPRRYFQSLKEIRKGGKYYIGAKSEGLLKTTWAEGELKQLFQIESEMAGLLGDLPKDMGKLTKAWTRIEAVFQKGGAAYQKLEEWSKLAHYIDGIERRGLTSAEAAAEAQKWLFDYGRVTKFQEKYRSHYLGAPFATFTFKAMPRVAEAAIKTPWRFALPAALIFGLEEAARRTIGDTPEEEAAKRELRPSWQKGSFAGLPNFARTPLIDDDGREYYWNLTYWLPWGDIGEGGGFGPIPGSLVPLSQPFVKETFQQIVNYDAFWEEQIIKPEDTGGLEGVAKYLTETEIRGKHLGQSLAPTLVLDVIKGAQAIRGRPDWRGRERHPLAVGLDVFAGIKLYPVEYAEQMVREVNRLDPGRGEIASKIRSQIRMLSIKRKVMEQKGKSTDHYDKEIALKIKQLQGLAKQLTEKGEKTRALFQKKKMTTEEFLGKEK